uniref:Uncharacterized protein LOC100176110 n=1 Tax=Phallusia mammillata TaxID=59560 RepID=A0A6F9DGL1_9ASCI|nr:uncharacterized protein LOC100176110 [Phallusia mammillata]
MYGTQIINMLVSKVSPDKICSGLGLCNNKMTMLGDTCELCNVIAQELEHLLESTSTEEEIISVVEKVCTIIPSQYESECDSLIEQYGSTIIELLVNLEPPEKLCALLGLCTGVKVAAKSDEFCVICQLVMGELDKLLNENSTENEIVAALEKVCSILPGELKEECDDFLKSIGPAILELLIKKLSPADVCPALNLCPKLMNKVKNDFVSAGELCDVCKIVITFVDQELSANATEAELEAELKKVCAQVPGELKDTCDDLVQQYTPDILKLLDNIFDPDYVCLHLKLCTSARPKVIVGANPCTYGPSYWCKNEQTARECHALKHCQQHIWE